MEQIHDLRSAIEYLRQIPGQLVETNVEADSDAEISGIYRHVGAGGTTMRPTKMDGPAMIFNNVKGFPNSKVVIGMLSSRKRVGLLLHTDPNRLGWFLRDAVKNTIAPVIFELKIRRSIFENSYQHRPTRRKMQDHTSRWGYARAQIQKTAIQMSRFIDFAYSRGTK